MKHGGVISRKNNRDAVAPESRQRMVRDSRLGETQLFPKRAGTDVALGANFQRDAAVDEQVHQRRILRGRNAVSDALDVQQLDSLADSFRAADFPGVHQEMKAIVRGLFVDRAKFLSGYTHFV